MASELIIEALALPLQPKVRELLRRARMEGLDPIIPATGGVRTAAEQMKNFQQGRHHDDTGRWAYDDPVRHIGVVTNALPEKSPHCHRAAVDVELLQAGRVLTLDAQKLTAIELGRQLVLYCKLGQIGEDLGLVWGGRFKAIRDYDHFELPDWKSLPLAG